MIDYETYTLPNGLTVVLHHDPQRTVVSVNVLYKVGSRNDPPGRTGFAHLFEHLMFEGSENVDNFDDVLQMAGGENNAVTGADTTMYYDVLPAANVETALYLESDRMRQLRFSKKSLRTQQKVVVEEFKETCLEEPYGDVFHHLSELVYRVHPYRWPVIGQNFQHIEEATLEDVKDFYYRYYRPDNAVLVVAGGYDREAIAGLVDKHFGDIPATDASLVRPTLPEEPEQTEPRAKVVRGDVPSPVIYLYYRTPGRLDDSFHALDVAAFLLGGGRSSYLYRKLIRDSDLFAEVAAGMNDTYDYSGFMIDARPSEGEDYTAARTALFSAVDDFVREGITQEQLDKTINRLEHVNQFKQLSVSNRANDLAFYASFDRLELVNTETQRYLDLTVERVNEVIRKYLCTDCLSTIDYLVED
ncbi:M16 family metallopeptidase [Neolewinella antarctica]|uniref:Zn-dependent peptidase n=1 Tax=Neolewinella antarctica TaxID=442734 RepID=A0ABX0XD93_9BACT|nr:pitrilysin family protein [Neolewinella antarctica]NJC27278.1 putative Zn-dependent peptidase [Neolewinella antarctica]